ncbi:MAG: 2-dehydropantoate 2-reductase [Methylibium sp. NZG]|nr:MAG: 2-dehydropantoate 2-reductase [Methylibium sp. NZG]
MKIAVVGVGAVGGLMAARLVQAGHEVCALARGATLATVRDRGLRLRSAGQESVVPLRASAQAHDLGEQDLVVIAVKGTTLATVAETLQPLLGPKTAVMPAMNGVPWWFLQTPPTCDRLAPQDRRIASIDPDGRIEAALPLPRVLGCVVHLTCSSPEPGVVQHGFGERLIVGEPAGGSSARMAEVCAALSQAGFKAEASAQIRSDVWYKLWGNMTMNPLSALTGSTTAAMLDDPLVHGFILRTMAEAAEVGAQLGCPISQSGEERMALTRQLGAFKTSMLQDALAGRALELDALVSAVHEIGLRFGVAMPNIGALLGMTRLMARERGLYPR